MILEKLSNKVSHKKNIYRSTWKVETDKIGSMGVGGRRECRRERGGEKREEEKNLREWGSRDGGRTEMRARKDILIEGAIIGLARNLTLEKFPGTHKDDPS